MTPIPATPGEAKRYERNLQGKGRKAPVLILHLKDDLTPEDIESLMTVLSKFKKVKRIEVMR
jgi:hypothetical protein